MLTNPTAKLDELEAAAKVIVNDLRKAVDTCDQADDTILALLAEVRRLREGRRGLAERAYMKGVADVAHRSNRMGMLPSAAEFAATLDALLAEDPKRKRGV